jgi:hypothetical protein
VRQMMRGLAKYAFSPAPATIARVGHTFLVFDNGTVRWVCFAQD